MADQPDPVVMDRVTVSMQHDLVVAVDKISQRLRVPRSRVIEMAVMLAVLGDDGMKAVFRHD